MRLARILALLLVVVTLAVSAYLLAKTPFAWIHLIPANLGVLGSVYFWRKAPKRKKARKSAAAASTLVVPAMFASAALSLLYAPTTVWPVFLALTALAFLIAIIAIVRIQRKDSHVWSNYYADVD